MRVNIDGHELTGSVEMVTADVDDPTMGPMTRWGLRIHVGEALRQYQARDGKRTSAVTFWLPAKIDGQPDAGPLGAVLLAALTCLRQQAFDGFQSTTDGEAV